ncbi:related to Cytosolic Fe-S cluster assembly factor NBP35 [Hanseniaspora guilliermondii]|uniref:Related to Cytosolic Fe-S cluster assembly factor NBP35 n=1 Tax=Hanseniaspora guilliermondii TaxID=56406 RepID=A0A1L0FKN7_9ASCO|nr:related to Cytosolic Fe-S cluster assembly factor NBP35 [Hanseniaspora guilliermondii]
MTSNVIKDEPLHCPGPESEDAGQSSACNTCNYQQFCSSNQSKNIEDPDIQLIKDNLSNIKNKVLVLSGKGGVGKSTFSTLLSFLLSSDPDMNIGLLDLDITGPSIPKMIGTMNDNNNAQLHSSNNGLIPHYIQDNFASISIQYLLPSVDQPIIWKSSKKEQIIKKFLKDTQWSDLDFLIIDTPPGTSDEHIFINKLLNKTKSITGAIIITTPQEVALNDVRKEINFCQKVNINILGLVENMSGFVCNNCNKSTDIFKPTTGGGKALCEEFNIPYWGKLPIDPRLGICCDQGESFIDTFPDSDATKSLIKMGDLLLDQCDY